MRASMELLMNQQRIISMGTPLCSCTTTCATNAPKKTSHQLAVGTSRSEERSIAFGGQSVETELAGNVKAKPISAPI